MRLPRHTKINGVTTSIDLAYLESVFKTARLNLCGEIRHIDQGNGMPPLNGLYLQSLLRFKLPNQMAILASSLSTSQSVAAHKTWNSRRLILELTTLDRQHPNDGEVTHETVHARKKLWLSEIDMAISRQDIDVSRILKCRRVRVGRSRRIEAASWHQDPPNFVHQFDKWKTCPIALRQNSRNMLKEVIC